MVGMLTLFFALFLPSAHAAGTSDAITAGVTGGLKNVYGILEKLIVGVATVFLALNLFKLFWGSQRDMDACKKYIIVCIVVIMVVLLAPTLVSEVAGWFGTGHWEETFG